MMGFSDALKLGAGSVAGAALAGLAVSAWFSFVEIPAAERKAAETARLACEEKVNRARLAEAIRQADANRAAQEQARQREADLAQQNDDLNEQLLDLANAITSDDSAARLCLSVDRVRDLDAIR